MLPITIGATLAGLGRGVAVPKLLARPTYVPLMRFINDSENLQRTLAWREVKMYLLPSTIPSARGVVCWFGRAYTKVGMNKTIDVYRECITIPCLSNL